MERLIKQIARPWFFLGLCIAIFITWIAWAFIVRARIPDWNHRGLSGDMYGSLNTLFTGLAFVGLVYTILLQKSEALDAERERAEERKIERQQRFENTFFQLLNSLNQIIDSTEVMNANHKTVKGRAYFKQLLAILQESYFASPNYSQYTGKIKVEKAYGGFYAYYQTDLGHYFRTLYHIFKHIDRSSVEDKEYYAHLARAQLSSQQLSLLFYNCLVDVGDGFKPLVEKYNLLKHLDKDAIKDKSLLSIYSPNAYAVGAP